MTAPTPNVIEMTPFGMYEFVVGFLKSSCDADIACGVYEALEVLASTLMRTTLIADWATLKTTLSVQQRHVIAEQMASIAQDLMVLGVDPHGAVARQLFAINLHASTLNDPVAVCVEQFIDTLIVNRIGSFPAASLSLH